MRPAVEAVAAETKPHCAARTEVRLRGVCFAWRDGRSRAGS
jgi:hypothetical protein